MIFHWSRNNHNFSETKLLFPWQQIFFSFSIEATQKFNSRIYLIFFNSWMGLKDLFNFDEFFVEYLKIKNSLRGTCKSCGSHFAGIILTPSYFLYHLFRQIFRVLGKNDLLSGWECPWGISSRIVRSLEKRRESFVSAFYSTLLFIYFKSKFTFYRYRPASKN
jgi:hypothetical protein